MWHYYNGAQLKVFDQLVQEFNDTVGSKKGIVVTMCSYGSVNDDKVLEAIGEKVGAEEVPDTFSAYADTVYAVNSLGKVADLAQYLSEAEQNAYISSYLEKGRFESGRGVKLPL